MIRSNHLFSATLTCICLFSTVLPVQASSGKLKPEVAGATLFREKGCAYCHGPAAAGTSKGPSLADVRKSMKTPQIIDQITNGGQKMPAFSDSLSNDEILQLVAFLRAKHRPVVPPVAQTAPAPSPLSNPAQ
jgi:mono/diheme cytochrome c family protein